MGGAPSLDITRSSAVANEVVGAVGQVIIGKTETIENAIIALLADGHILIEDIPGIGKTTLAKALARVMGGTYRRIQFTPDLLPADITGCSLFNQKTVEFEFRPGPVFANVVLADELNRATPKTQSSLLEAMEERQVTADGVVHPLPTPFLVLATQNNIELTGTYPLPEAQMDRFLARLSIGYPDRDSEVEILREQQVEHPLAKLESVITPDQLREVQQQVRRTYVHDSVREYVVDVVRATREEAGLVLGASPRGSLLLAHAAQAAAVLAGRDFVSPDDVKRVAEMVIAHRLIGRSEVRGRSDASPKIVRSILDHVPVPVAVR
jgi:MoxR-like ATPase